MQKWLPLTSAVVKACAKCNSAAKAFLSNKRLLRVCGLLTSPLSESLRLCDPNDKLCIVYGAKFLKMDSKKVTLCRVMSGTLRQSDFFYQKVFLLKFNIFR